MKNSTVQDIFSAEDIGIKYDQAAKTLWRNREIIAPLLKYAVKELADETVESIMGLIDADTIRDDVPVSDLPTEVVERSEHHPSVTEMPITFDFSLRVKNPQLSVGDMLVMIHVDVEFQNKYHPSSKDGRTYPLVKRGIYYSAREISRQLGRITQQTNYSDIEKVISIWVVNDGVTKGLHNTATRYYIEKDDFIGQSEEPKEDYDLLEVVILRRGDSGEVTEPLFEYLKGVFDANLETIDKYTPASSNPEIKEEVEKMPGMSQTIYNNGYDSGYGNGFGSGYDRSVIEMVDEGDITIARAAEKLNRSTDEIQKLLDEYISSKKEMSSAE